MRASTEHRFVAGPAGRIECAIDKPASAPRGSALIAHPHPQFGGTLDNKVVQTLARAFVELGYESWRPNFRGVGESEGKYDEGRGEVEDLLSVFSRFSEKNIVLAGFSFGAAMQARLTEKLKNEKQFKPEKLVLVGVAVANFEKLRDAKTVKLNGDHDVFGDGSVVIKSTPGHTPGHQSLAVRLPKTGLVLLSGLQEHPARRPARRCYKSVLI